jgi:hypothetical protein
MVLQDGDQLRARQQRALGQLVAAAHLGQKGVKGGVGGRQDLLRLVGCWMNGGVAV